MDIINLNQQPQHIPQLAEWHHREWSYLNPNGTLAQRAQKMQMYLSDNLIPSTFVCVTGDRPTGSAAIITSDMDTHLELSPWLASVFVAPEFRCEGIGSSLVKHVMTRAKEAGIPALYLFTPDQQPFYARLGWSVRGQELYRGTAVTVMEIDLTR